MALFSMGQLKLASLAFYGSLSLLLVYHLLSSRIVHATSIVVGVIPCLGLLRSLFYHNSVSVLFAMILMVWYLLKPSDFKRLFTNPMARRLVIAGLLYWLASFALTGRYSQNLRMMDMVGAAALICILARYREFAAASFGGIAICVVCIAYAMVNSGYERLGMSRGEMKIGSPANLATPAALILILCYADNGRWLLLPSKRMRYVLSAIVGVVVLLTTSRTNWAVAFSAMSLLFLLQSGNRKQMIAGAIVIALAIMVVLGSSRGESVKKYFFKVASSERDISQKTTGRFDMYAAFPKMLEESPVVGYGPGAARTYEKKKGDLITVHSFYLHIGLETGLLGLALLLTYLFGLGLRSVRHYFRYGETLALVGVVCFGLEGLAHNNLNPAIGLFLGLSVLAADRTLYRHVPMKTMPAPATTPVPSGNLSSV